MVGRNSINHTNHVQSWLKVKKDYDSAADSLDLVPIAGWHGSGRKAKWLDPILSDRPVTSVRTGDSHSQACLLFAAYLLCCVCVI